jgi:hypothetical protein
MEKATIEKNIRPDSPWTLVARFMPGRRSTKGNCRELAISTKSDGDVFNRYPSCAV